MTFQDINLSDNLITALKKQNITEPTKIQSSCYQYIRDNRDVIACSHTGSGKTLAYLLPVISKIDYESKYIQALILVPTQELAVQVHDQIELLFHNAGMKGKSLFVIGEGNLNRQIDALKNKPHIVVGTPVRVDQLISMKKMRVHDVKTLIIDEADKLVDKTYLESVLAIRKSLMKYIQVLMYSASIDKRARQAANDLTFKPVVFDFGNDTKEALIPKTIKHVFIIADRRERNEILRKIAKAIKSDKVLIFINTKYDLEESYQKLQYHNYSVASLSGNQDKLQKKNALDGFKSGKYNYLLATDVAARGLQIEHIDAVINVNLPEDSKEYLHRAGRCGRNGNEGVCISVITDNELSKIKKLQKDLHINIVQKKLYQGKLVAK